MEKGQDGGPKPDMMMDDIMRRWPQTIRVLLRHHLLCVGCPIAGFHTLEDACREHGQDETSLREDILQAIAAKDDD